MSKKKSTYTGIRKRVSSILKKGAPPGSLIHVGEQKMEVADISVIQYSTDSCTEFKPTDISALASCLKPGYFTWINVDGVHDASIMEALAQLFKLDHLSLEDVMNANSRAKFEEFNDYLFVVIKDLACPHGIEFYKEQICFVIKDDLLITFQEYPGDVFENVRNRLRSGVTHIRERGTDYLAYALLDAVVDNYMVIAETFEHRLDGLEDELYTTTNKEQLTKIRNAKNDFTVLKRAINPMKELVFNMHRTEHTLVTDKTHIFIRDLYDHVNNLNDTLEQARDKVYGLMSIYNSGANNMMNNIMKTLTIVSTIFMASSLIAGIYGMNFSHFLPVSDGVYSFYYVLGGMAAITLILIIYFRFKKWI